MLDTIPAEAIVLVLIGIWSLAPAKYLCAHVQHAPSRQDITQPPRDLSWRTSRRFALNAALLAALAASAVFVFTPQARAFAGSAFFLPSLLTAIGTFALHAAGHGLLSGSVRPLLRGLTDHYSREDQPKRFWASVLYNAVLGGALLSMVPSTYAEGKRSRCIDGDRELEATQEACSALLDDEMLSKSDRRAALIARGRSHAEAGSHEQAMLDLDRAIRLDNTDPEAFHLRGSLHERRGHRQWANEDYNSAILLAPDDADIRLTRGVFYLNHGNLSGALEDLNRADALDPDNVWVLANRGLTEAWLGNLAAAKRDLNAARARDPRNIVVLGGDAVVKSQSGNVPGALKDIDALLAIDPDNEWARNFRETLARKAKE